MQLTAYLLVLSLSLSARSVSQQITLSGKNVSLQKVFEVIKAQTGFTFLGSKNVISAMEAVSVDVKDMELPTFLELIALSKPFQFEIKGETIFIKKRATAFPEPAAAKPPVKGKILSINGEPIAGANIIIAGTKRGTTTKADGSFSFDAKEGELLIISSIGFTEQKVVVNSSSIGNIYLAAAEDKMQEVQIIAYGTTTRKYSTSNIGNVSSEKIANQPVTNPLLALQGRVPGLQITQTTGQTAGNVNVVIQGLNSIAQRSDPFYVIDGIPYAAYFTDQTLMGANIAGVEGGSALNFINPADIESVEILKDADATAIYGSRAANGAILITTKKGKAGKTKVDLNLQNGWGKVARRLHLMNTAQYLEMRKEAYVNDGLPVPTTSTSPDYSNFDLTIWEQNKYHDWQQELIGGTANFNNIQATLSGGNNQTQFLVGTGYNRHTTVYPNDLADLKNSVHFNINHSSDNKKFKFFLNGNYLQNRNEMNGSDLTFSAIFTSPNAPDLYNSDKTLNWGPFPEDPSRFSFQNPMYQSEIDYLSRTNNLLANAVLSYEIIPGLFIKTSGGYNILEGNEMVLNKIESFKPDALTREPRSSFLDRSITSYIVEPQVAYSKIINKSNVIDLLAGTTFQQARTRTIGYNATGFANNSQLANIAAATSVVPVIGRNTDLLYKYNAFFSRLNYRFRDKYIMNVNLRRDGSSRFGNDNKFHDFYSVGAAWLFGDEQFIKQAIPFLSMGKLRINYGTTGNDQIGDYGYASLLENISLGMPYQNLVGITPSRLANPGLQWEETRKFNAGVDLSLLNNRITTTINYFRNRSSNQLISYQLPFVTGFNFVTTNFPATVQNTGVELTVDVTPIRSKNLTWNFSANATIPRNKLLYFEDFENSTYTETFVIGKPINIRRLYQFAGVDAESGLYSFHTKNGELTNYPSYVDDRLAYFDPTPKWYGGLSNTITYKNFTLDFLFQYVNQRGATMRFGGGGYGFINNNAPLEQLERWQKPGDVTAVEKFSNYGSWYAPDSDAAYGDASFLRLKNASLSYAFPAKVLDNIRVSSARLYVLGQNLATITNFYGLDPETNGALLLPPLRMLTLGLQVTF